MSLTKYKEKRDFKKTPEPVSGKKESKAKLVFVVQRHDATRLHYDFRLEMEGVLKSWAVPKGPSMVAGDKRLAVMVEDHPFDYRKFYGEIPEGSYGAGIVEIWDQGSYKPYKPAEDQEKALLEGLNKGDLKFVLNGTYLKGAFALVRIKDDEGKNWLLIKKKDEHATSRFDIEKIPSLKTKNIKKKPRSSAKRASNPKHEIKDDFPTGVLTPMLAKLSNKITDLPDWIYEIKFDGYRCISKINDRKVEMLTRNNINVTATYSPISDELKKIEDDVILDGELIVEKKRGLPDFQALQNYTTSKKGRLKYHVFDILFLNGHNVADLKLSQRKELLDAFINSYKFKNIVNTRYQTGNGQTLFEELSAKGFEGIIAKDPDSIYLPGKRTDKWLKIKNVTMQEAVICGYTAPQNSRQYFGSLILGVYEKKELKYAGNVGTGFTEASLKELHDKMDKIKTGVSPFKTVPKMIGPKGKPVWIRPELVCNVKYAEWTSDNHLRHPVFMGLRIDKPAEEVIRESATVNPSVVPGSGLKDSGSKFRVSRSGIRNPEPAASQSVIGKKNSSPRNQKSSTRNPRPETPTSEPGTPNLSFSGKDPEKEMELTLSGKKLKLTNLKKIYWPDEGYTKGDLINYYRGISKYILPYLKNRPQSLNRHPNGIKGQSFYQKDMNVEQIPGWVKTERIYSKSNNDYIDYLICNDAAALVFMANLGCIELNPWHSTYLKPDNPTYLMIDLDPGNTPFTEVIQTALAVKEICDEIKIPAYCKTSGATGLHIYIPLAEQYDYDEAKTFAEILAVITHNRIPEISSIERVVAKRGNKVYIDFLQNRKGQTIAAPYSVRPKELATVSAPLDWDEVKTGLSPQMFTIKNMLERLEKKGDLWKPVIRKGVNLQRALKAIEKLS